MLKEKWVWQHQWEEKPNISSPEYFIIWERVQARSNNHPIRDIPFFHPSTYLTFATWTNTFSHLWKQGTTDGSFNKRTQNAVSFIRCCLACWVFPTFSVFIIEYKRVGVMIQPYKTSVWCTTGIFHAVLIGTLQKGRNCFGEHPKEIWQGIAWI